MKSSSPDARVTTTTKRAAKENRGQERAREEAVLGQEVIERLKSWCYV